MSPATELSWLCRLVDECRLPHREPDALVSMCKQKEKEFLLASSQVVREIQLRIRGFDSHAEEAEEKSTTNEDGLCGSNDHSSVHQCLPKIVAEMIVLLTVKSEFVRHVAVNALVLTSMFVSITGNDCGGFIHLVCRFLEMAIARVSSCFPAHPSGAVNGDFDLSGEDFLIQYGLENCDWSTVAGITQVLRVICKRLKEGDYDDELMEVFYDSVNSCLLKVHWDLLDEYQSRDIGGTMNNSSKSQICFDSFGAMEPGMKFIGIFLQLLSSLVDRNDFVEASCDSANKHPLLVTVINLIPRLVKWCLDKQEDRTQTGIIHYLKHKLLILMVRVGSLTCLDCLIRLSWLELLHNYFHELLRQPLTHFQSDQDDCLEGSPFLLSLSDGEAHGVHSSHLQRQAIFLLLDCSFSLICQKGEIADHSHRKKGTLELYTWIQGHLPTKISINQEQYQVICMNFMSSFLKLYLHEDDLLFEVLLQLLSISSSLQQQLDRKEAAYQDVKKDFPFDMLDIFNPVHLFHWFLLEIHYDHQVLLDYLISEDTGINCAKYLLRCLHLICNSWKLFVEFPLFVEVFNQSSCKRRKVLGDGIEILADGMPSAVDNDGRITLHIKNYKEDNEYGFKHYHAFNEAAACLLSLNNSVKNLHQKNLFPYNPEVLLKRLRRFQEFCRQEKGFHGEKIE